MQVFSTLREAQDASDARDAHFVEIRRIALTGGGEEWRAYETPAEVPPEPQQA